MCASSSELAGYLVRYDWRHLFTDPNPHSYYLNYQLEQRGW